MADKDLGTLLRAKSLLQGYYLPRPGEDGGVSFHRAKNEAIMNLQSQIEDIRNLTTKDFFTKTQAEIDDATN